MKKKKHNIANLPANESGTSISSNLSKRRSNSIVVIVTVVLIFAIVLSVGIGLSWFAPKTGSNMEVILSNFEAKIEYSINNSEFAELKNVAGNEIELNTEHLNTLKLQIKYTGPSSAYIRVQLFDSFYSVSSDNSKTLVATPDFSYILGEDWVKIGNYYYYKNIATFTENEIIVTDEITDETNEIAETGEITTKKEIIREPRIIDFVTATDYESSDSNASIVKLVAVVEAVQPDRFEEFFGVEPEVLFGTGTETTGTTE